MGKVDRRLARFVLLAPGLDDEPHQVPRVHSAGEVVAGGDGQEGYPATAIADQHAVDLMATHLPTAEHTA